MSEPKRPLKVFLCHAHANRDSVRELYHRLTRDGVDAWFDKAKLLPGQDWEYEIRKAVHEADIVVVCLSKQFNQAGFRQKEVRLALDTAMEKSEGEIFVIPARLEECDTLESLRKWHWVDLFEDDGYEALKRALRARANKIGATLQLKRSWLPRITSPRTKNQKPAEIKNLEELEESPVYIIGEIPDGEPPDKFPDGWETEWMPSIQSEETKSEVPNIVNESKRQWQKDEGQYKWRIIFSNIRKGLLSFLMRNGLPLIFALIVIIGVFYIWMIYILKFTPALFQTPTNDLMLVSEPTLISTETFVYTEIFTASSAPTENFTPTLMSLPTEITDAKGVQMVLVSAGEFIMGVDALVLCKEFFISNCETARFDNVPAREVSLETYYIDKYEVTNALYKACVDEKVCKPPENTSSSSHPMYYGHPSYNDYPVIFVDWTMAVAYCEWRSARLPTEAEWEKAARGTSGHAYPWGEEIDNTRANYDKNVGDTTAVGSYESGEGPYGTYDMAGNVSEWVVDQYINYYTRVLRGGSWKDSEYRLRSYARNWSDPFESNHYGVGFRCAR